MLFSINGKGLKKVTFQLFWLVFLIANFCVFSLPAQSRKSEKVLLDSCEEMIAKLDFAMNDFVKNAKPDSYLVIIGGAIKGEKSSYNSRRIQEAIGYIDWAGNKKIDRIVFGIGTSETEAGFLRFFVNGVLSAEIRTSKNGTLCWGEGGELEFSKKN